MDKQIWLGWILIPILFFAFFVRTINLAGNPPELFSDEITHVLSARTIIETGKDINGKLNLYLYNRLKYGAPIYGYLAAFSTYIFGNNTSAIRLPAVLAGTLTVYLIYKLTLLITKDKRTSLLSALVAALIPWNIYFSRIAWEPSLILPFILSGILSFYKALGSQNVKKVFLPYIIFATAVYAADALEFLAPLFLCILILINLKNIWGNKSRHILGAAIFVIILIPYAFITINNPLKYERSIKISTFSSGVNSSNVKVFAKNYIAHFSPNFLFLKGDPNLRHGTGGNGVIYWSLSIFVIMGIIYSIKNINKGYSLFILIWLAVFPLGGSLTNDGVPHATRTLIGAPVFIILFAIGFSYFLTITHNLKLKNFLTSILVITICLEFLNFARDYFLIYPLDSQPWWDYGEKKIFLSIKNHTKGDESLCLPNVEYWHEDTYPNYYLGVGNKYKMTFYLDDPACLKSDILVLPSEKTPPNGYKKIDVINDLSKKPIWTIYEGVSRNTQ